MMIVGSMLCAPPPGADAAAYAKSGKSIQSEASAEGVRRVKHQRMILHTLDCRQKSHALAHVQHACEFPIPVALCSLTTLSGPVRSLARNVASIPSEP